MPMWTDYAEKKCVIECINEQLKSSTFMTHVCAQFYN